MNRFAYIAPFLIVVTVSAAEISEKFGMRIKSTEANYQSAVQKADNVRFYAVQKAAAERLKSLKSALSDATKSGDFDAATKLKELVTAAESGTVRQKPKDTIKAGGHEYAIVKDSLSFYNARKRCEEMGGHLVTLETAQEQELIRQRARQAKIAAWIGATNEEDQVHWKWVTGDPVADEQARAWRHDNYDSTIHAHGMTWWPDSDGFNDDSLGARMGFICEWDK